MDIANSQVVHARFEMEWCKEIKQISTPNKKRDMYANSINGSNLKRGIKTFQVVRSWTAIATQQIATKVTFYTLVEILKKQRERVHKIS